MNFHQKGIKDRSLNVQGRLVLVAVRYSAEISNAALIWALNHVVQTDDYVKLLVVIPPHNSNKKLWSFPRFRDDCKAGRSLSFLGTTSDQKEYITDSCTQMMLGLHQFYDPDKVKVKIRVVSGAHPGIVSSEAKRDPTHWVVLDKSMKKEAKCCEEQLDCNVVLMRKSGPKVLRLNMTESSDANTDDLSGQDEFIKNLKMISYDGWDTTQVPNVTPVGSPEHTAFTSTDIGTSSQSSFDLCSSTNLNSEIDRLVKKDKYLFSREEFSRFDKMDFDTDIEKLSRSTSLSSQQWVANILSSAHEYSRSLTRCSQDFDKMHFSIDTFARELSEVDLKSQIGAVIIETPQGEMAMTNVRDIVSLTTKTPANPPPLCSVCQHKAPVFGKPPEQFTFAELERATDGFSQPNFLAEGGYGCVHRGILPDGQVVAIKQHKAASTQGDQEFCSEVEVLSYAQHRNVVLLIGFCAEDGRRLLVYEYICNGSLDAHLYGRKHGPLDWSARQKVAIGAARGLRYLHEECRVGCIIHRDLRPNNILLTHDFVPLVGDFGLARWQPDGGLGEDTRIIGTFGYVAPEYAQSGLITEKTDVYAFGIILIQLVTGKKVIDLNRPRGQQCLLDWARPLLEEIKITELIDPVIENCYSEQQVHSMLRCASLCIERDPLLRPRVSQALHILEGGFK